MKPTLANIERRVAVIENAKAEERQKEDEEQGLIIFCTDTEGNKVEIWRSSDYRPAKKKEAST